MAGIAGLLAVILVMLVYYKRAGVNAVLALMLNTVMLLAALAYFNAILTLPGIAGIILTIGMAVDSNVLIFERIREELRSGKAIDLRGGCGLRQGMVDDCRHARDHVVSCAFLFISAEGPVQGFRGDPGDRLDRECFHRGVRVEDDLRLRTFRPQAVDGAEYLISLAGTGYDPSGDLGNKF